MNEDKQAIHDLIHDNVSPDKCTKLLRLIKEKDDSRFMTLLSDHNCPPLHQAARLGRASLFEILLQYGADMWIADRNGQLPVHRAATEDKIEVLKIIFKHNLSALTAINGDNLTPLLCAIRVSSKNAVSYILHNHSPECYKSGGGLHHNPLWFVAGGNMERDEEDAPKSITSGNIPDKEHLGKYTISEIMGELTFHGCPNHHKGCHLVVYAAGIKVDLQTFKNLVMYSNPRRKDLKEAMKAVVSALNISDDENLKNQLMQIRAYLLDLGISSNVYYTDEEATDSNASDESTESNTPAPSATEASERYR